MKTSELKVGSFYAYQDWKHSPKKRVKVLATGQKREGKRDWSRSSYGSRTSPPANGVQVQHDNGFTEVVRPEKLVSTWSAEVKSRKQQAQWRREREQRETDTRTKRAQQAKMLHDAMVANGAPVKTGYTYDSDDFAALVEAGFERLDDTERYEYDNHVKSAVYDLSDLMRKGEVDLADVAVAMGWETPEPAEDDGDDEY